MLTVVILSAASADTIPKSVDNAMDKEVPSSNGQNGQLEVDISIRNGPVREMDIDEPGTNGLANGKRKQRASINGKSYKEATSSDEDDKPLVRHSSCYLRASLALTPFTE